jgi:hypothetical protein
LSPLSALAATAAAATAAAAKSAATAQSATNAAAHACATGLFELPDMRPSINPYAIEGEAPRYTTPALDELARTGTLFTRAYIQISYCAPSRNSFMSGRRPDSSNIYSFIGTFRDPASGQHWVALPEHFVQNGYNVGGSGKLFHPGVPANFDQPWSWTVPYVEYGKEERLLLVSSIAVMICHCKTDLGLHYGKWKLNKRSESID